MQLLYLSVPTLVASARCDYPRADARARWIIVASSDCAIVTKARSRRVGSHTRFRRGSLGAASPRRNVLASLPFVFKNVFILFFYYYPFAHSGSFPLVAVAGLTFRYNVWCFHLSLTYPGGSETGWLPRLRDLRPVPDVRDRPAGPGKSDRGLREWKSSSEDLRAPWSSFPFFYSIIFIFIIHFYQEMKIIWHLEGPASSSALDFGAQPIRVPCFLTTTAGCQGFPDGKSDPKPLEGTTSIHPRLRLPTPSIHSAITYTYYIYILLIVYIV